MKILGQHMTEKKLQPILNQLREQLKLLYGDKLYQLILYGSQARGDSEAGSDIDILVILEGSIDSCKEIARTENIVAEISLRYNIVLACVFVSRDRYENYRSPLYLNIHREGVAI
jgi:predicted nucleotidyltransferase